MAISWTAAIQPCRALDEMLTHLLQQDALQQRELVAQAARLQRLAVSPEGTGSQYKEPIREPIQGAHQEPVRSQLGGRKQSIPGAPFASLPMPAMPSWQRLNTAKRSSPAVCVPHLRPVVVPCGADVKAGVCTLKGELVSSHHEIHILINQELCLFCATWHSS